MPGFREGNTRLQKTIGARGMQQKQKFMRFASNIHIRKYSKQRFSFCPAKTHDTTTLLPSYNNLDRSSSSLSFSLQKTSHSHLSRIIPLLVILKCKILTSTPALPILTTPKDYLWSSQPTSLIDPPHNSTATSNLTATPTSLPLPTRSTYLSLSHPTSSPLLSSR